MADKNTIICTYNMQHDIAKDECNETNSNHDTEDVDDLDVNEDHHDDNSILSAPLDDNSIQSMKDMDTATFLDTAILNNCLMEYLCYANLKTNERRSDNTTDIMIAAIKLLTISSIKGGWLVGSQIEVSMCFFLGTVSLPLLVVMFCFGYYKNFRIT